jgi:hypothetical protein
MAPIRGIRIVLHIKMEYDVTPCDPIDHKQHAIPLLDWHRPAGKSHLHMEILKIDEGQNVVRSRYAVWKELGVKCAVVLQVE